jgi:hypothetical protein
MVGFHRPRRRPIGLVLSFFLVSAVAYGVAGVTDVPRVGASNPAWATTPQWSRVLDDNGSPVEQSSPNIATLDGDGPSVVVGDARGAVYAYHLDDGSPVSGWPVQLGVPVDSTPSVAPTNGSPYDTVFVGSGTSGDPTEGGYQAIGPGGNLQWFTPVVDPPSDGQPYHAVEASMSVGSLQGGTGVVAGSLGQEAYALSASDGSALPGWPFFTSDTVFSTPALSDLYGTGQTEIVEGGDQTAGFALGKHYSQGGHLRILNDRGGLICSYDTDQNVGSSPAVGNFLPGGATGAAFGTGTYFAGASDNDAVLAVDNRCNLVWSTTLDASTSSSPALADVQGNGTEDVVEETDNGSTGSVWVLNAANGQPLWHAPIVGRGLGSVTTADLFGTGHQDLLVPTTAGVEIFDGVSGEVVAELSAATSDPNGILGFINSPLVTDDADGNVGITVAGYTYNSSGGQGVIEHFEIPDSNGPQAVGTGSWPEFHHDAQLTGSTGAGAPTAPCDAPAAAFDGYDMVARDGGIFSFGNLPFCGSTGNLILNAPIVGMAQSSNTGGYWLAASDGGVFAFNGAGFYGSMGGQHLNKPIVGMAATPDGKGYWLVASDGGVFTFGDAQYWGSTGNLVLNNPVVGIAATPDGLGYWLVASDGGVFTFGDAQFFGSTGSLKLKAPIVGMANDPQTDGYWLVASDGGVFSFNAPFYGSMGGQFLNAPIVGIGSANNGQGYQLVASDGGLFSYGIATFRGSMGGQHLNQPIVGIAGY